MLVLFIFFTMLPFRPVNFGEYDAATVAYAFGTLHEYFKSAVSRLNHDQSANQTKLQIVLGSLSSRRSAFYVLSAPLSRLL